MHPLGPWRTSLGAGGGQLEAATSSIYLLSKSLISGLTSHLCEKGSAGPLSPVSS